MEKVVKKGLLALYSMLMRGGNSYHVVGIGRRDLFLCVILQSTQSEKSKQVSQEKESNGKPSRDFGTRASLFSVSRDNNEVKSDFLAAAKNSFQNIHVHFAILHIVLLGVTR